ncbi:MAG: 3'-5' exonuclease [Planctomycetaceae bacterium]|nr:3'-5' exonuclease [Planctomycetaceae bacterium]
MDDSKSQVQYLIFDCEAIADGDLVAKIRYPQESLAPQQAIRKYRDQVLAERTDGKDILPVTYMLPVSVAVAKVDARFRLLDLATLDAPQYRPHVITKHFWQGWTHYQRPTLVSFNGRGYDLPLLELAAFRYGLSVPQWFNIEEKSYEQARNRYNLWAHLDLCDVLSNFGATRLSGGLNLIANLIGKPGKTGVDGSKVQDMYEAGQIQAINDYCRCDVLDTYFVFLRTRVLLGKLKLDEEQELVAETKAWLESRAETLPVYADYLKHWGEWAAPGD